MGQKCSRVKVWGWQTRRACGVIWERPDTSSHDEELASAELFTDADTPRPQVFDELRRSHPAQLDKLRALPGDTSKDQLGLDSSSLAQLREVRPNLVGQE